MKIAILLKSFAAGGVERITLILARHLVERGHQVSLIVLKNRGPLAGKVDRRVEVQPLKSRLSILGRALVLRADPWGVCESFRPVLLPIKADKTICFLPALVRAIRKLQPEAVLAAMPYVNLEAVWATELAGSRARVVVNENIEISPYIEERRGWRHSYLLPLMARTYARANAIVGASNGVGDDLARATGLDRNRITTIYNPIVTTEMLEEALKPVDHPWFRSDSPPVVINIGRLADQKSHPTLLQAFARVRSQRNMRLVILGGAGTAEKTARRQGELMRVARDLGIEEDVQLLGFKENPYPYLARAGVFTLSSRYEGLPTVLVEAMACGCPVVSTACPGSVEILEDGKYGQIVPIGDADALGQAINKTLDSPPNTDTLKRRSLDFSAERSAEQFESVLAGTGGRA